MSKFVLQIKSGLAFFLRTFYDPKLYRDVAFRQKGYGLKPLYILFFILMIPSVLGYYHLIVNHFQKNFAMSVSKLPVLQLEKNKLYEQYQNINLLRLIDKHQFQWLPANTKPFETVNMEVRESPFLLGTDNLWMKLPKNHFFGYEFLNSTIDIPLIAWVMVKEPVFGKTILEALDNSIVYGFLLSSAIMMFCIHALMIFIFIRSFGLIASKMVLMLLYETIEYDIACRLLSLSAMPTLTIIYMINHFYYDMDLKVLFMGLYMFNFYIAIRFIKARSDFRWIKDIGA